MKLSRWKDWIRPAAVPPDEDEAAVEISKRHLLQALLGTALSLFTLYFVAALLFPRLGLRTDAVIYGRMISLGVLFLIARSGRTRLATALTIAIGMVLVTYTAFTNGGIRAPIVLMFPAIAASAGLLLNRNSSMLVGLATVVIASVLVVAGQRGLLPPSVRPPTPISTLIVLAMAMFVVTYLLRLSFNVLESALTRARKELAERREVERVLRQREAEIRALNADLEERVRARTAELSTAKEAAEAASRAKSTFLVNMSQEIRAVATR
jgi:signal transduction histidine kinase